MKARIGPPSVRPPSTRRLCLAIAVVVLTSIASALAGAAGGDPEEARAYFEQATTSFALGHYSEAADSFEKAFQAKPDSALLYNAAQAHRLAGNKERALTLYQNYLRLYPRAPKRAEAEARVAELRTAIEHDHVVATTPPTSTLPSSALSGDGKPATDPGTPPSDAAGKAGASSPSSAGATTVASAASGARAVDLRPSPPSPPSPPASGVAIRAQAEPSQPLTSKPLFWAAVAGALVVVMAVVVVVALGGDKDPAASLGVVR